jgi:hypothetical protein
MPAAEVRLHADGKGVLWVLAKCKSCGAVHKYFASEASKRPVDCQSCRQPFDLQHIMSELTHSAPLEDKGV